MGNCPRSEIFIVRHLDQDYLSKSQPMERYIRYATVPTTTLKIMKMKNWFGSR